MPHSRPVQIENRGDAHRVTRAAGAFIIELGTDRRVQANYQQWRGAWEAGREQLDRFLATRPAVEDAEVKAQIDAFAAGMRAALEHFVREELRLKPAWVPWVTDGLRELFQLAVYNEQHPEAPQRFGIPVFLQRGLPKGRLPRRQGLDIDRNIRWFYRARVQDPPDDNMSDLGRDYQSWAERTTDSRSVPQNGIKQAEALLDLVAARAVLLPPNN